MKDLEEKLNLIKDIKRFTVKELGIHPNPSFTKIGEVDKFYVVYASEKESIESAIDSKWGNESYENKQECDKRQKELEAQGFDTLQMTWEARGQIDCPITKSMLRLLKTRLTYLILHENFHIHCREENLELEPNVEEAVGDCFAYQGAGIYYFIRSDLKMINHVKRDFKDWMRFMDFGNKYLEKLEEAYKKNPTEGKLILKQAEKEAKRLSRKVSTKEVRERLALPINNAFFLRLKYYAPKVRPVYEILKDQDPKMYIRDKEKLYRLLESLE